MTVRKKMKKGILFGAGLILLFSAVWMLQPCYRSYMEKDHAVTCEKVRKYITLQYREKLEGETGKSQGSARMSGSVHYPGNTHALMAETLEESFRAQIQENEDGTMTCTGLCRGGGSYTIEIIKGSPFMVRITCSCPDHGSYILE